MLLPTLSFNDQTQRFENKLDEDTLSLIEQMDKPLSLTFQLTRNCNLRCVYCSELPGIASIKLEMMKEMIDKLTGESL
jgi:sulfatase maturation enzyme AslB (radical SAM superfamily)